MNEVKSTLRRMAVYYLLLAVNIIPTAGIITDSFPTRNLSTIYLLALSVCLVLYYFHRVTPTGALSGMMKAISLMALFLILLRGVKYSVVSEVGILARHAWYLYYVPILLLPLFLFYISLLVSPKDNSRISKAWYVTLAVTILFILLVLTNDLHQLVFRFEADFANWDEEYGYGWLFYAVNLWQFALYLTAIIILTIKCRIVSSKRSAWIILIPVAIGVVMYALLFTDKMPKLNNVFVIEFPEAHIFTAAVVLECCMQLGLVPTNTDYGKMFRNLSIAAQITDTKGTPVYSSATALPLTEAQFALPSGSRIDEHILLHKMEIPGGYGFWQDDMTELDRLNEELADAKERLAEETELIRLRNELKEKQAKIEHRTLMYDRISRRVQRQSQMISTLAQTARDSTDAEVKDKCRRRITLLGAYIKRYANLTLLSEESDVIQAGELALSLSELLRYLNYCGIPGEFVGGADRCMPAVAALGIFEAVEHIIETNYDALQGVFVNLSAKEKVIFKLTFENLTRPISDEVTDKLKEAGVFCEIKCEDGVTYVCLSVATGGVTV